jgi:hypothetical protein
MGWSSARSILTLRTTRATLGRRGPGPSQVGRRVGPGAVKGYCQYFQNVRFCAQNRRFGTYIWNVLYPAFVRGEAYPVAQQGNEAAAEFQKILDHRGIVWNSPIGALAHLQLGLAYNTQGDTPEAKPAALTPPTPAQRPRRHSHFQPESIPTLTRLRRVVSLRAIRLLSQAISTQF